MPIKKLEDFEHIRLRPGMYIGTTETPIHLLYELIDNAADECLVGQSNFLCVVIDKDNNKYSVVDKGRGIPLKSKSLKGEVPEVIATQLFSGGKFDNILYQHRSGLHGVGLVAVNALSSEFEIITVKNKNKHRKYVFNGKEVTKEDIPSKSFSTMVTFKPDQQYFDTIDIDTNTIIERLKSILVYKHKKNIEIKLIIKENKKETVIDIKNDIEEKFKKELTNFIEITNQAQNDDIKILIGYDEEVKTRKFFGVINAIQVHQGTHMKMIQNIIRDYLYNKATKKKFHVNKEDVTLGLRILCIAKITDPSFSGQTKYALDMKESNLENLISKNKIVKCLDNNSEFVDSWLQYAQDYRIDLDSKKKMKNKRTKKHVLVEGLRDCTSKNITERELFILEGESAGGTLLQCRDTTRHAVLPLRGKILNVNKASKDKFFNNKTIMSIFQTIGITPFSDDITTLRYDFITLTCDSDPDGGHITTLLLSLFDYAAPKIIEEGKLYIADAPLYGCYEKKKFIPIFDNTELEKYRAKGYHIYRFKGLGEMQPAELKSCILDHKTRKLIQVLPNTNPTLSVEKILKDKINIIKDYVKLGG
jgi:DNA gyrase subunit B